MFSLLSPFALWLAPLLAVPLAIALMGRAQPKTRDFPSLLPVQASLQRAMKRHRLKNWLQLILRTLALLCLLLAAAGPIWRGGSTLTPPALAGVLPHNNVYAGIPVSESQNSDTPDDVTIGRQANDLRQALDSLTAINQGQLITEYVFPEHGDGGLARASGLPTRYGHPGEALARLIRQLESTRGASSEAAHAFVPVFAARDLALVAVAAKSWLESRPGARLVVLDHSDATSRLNAFGRAEVDFDRNGMLALSVPTVAERAPVWTPASDAFDEPVVTRDAQAMELGDERASIVLPVSEDASAVRWIAGTIGLAQTDPARPGVAVYDYPVAIHIPPPSTLCHVGTRESFISLATLGEGGKRLNVVSLASPSAQPEMSRGDTPRVNREGCHLLYLADPPGADAALLSRAAAILRTGGTVILETGRHTDPVLWNRNLLAPLEVGRLTEPLTTKPTAVRVRRDDLATLGHASARADRWGKPGSATTRFGFRPAVGTRTLLTATPGEGREAGAVLIEKRIGTGRLLLWTTSLSDPAWSDIGLGPWAALFHQAVQTGTWADGVKSHATDSDSLTWLPAATPGDDLLPRVLDPKGEAFTRLRAEAGGFTVGPFDQTGLYRIINPQQDAKGVGSVSWLAVTLAEPPPRPTAADWAAFEEALGPVAWSRTVRLEAEDEWRSLYGGVRLRLTLLVMAALLLFAEGAVSLRLAHATQR